MKKIFIMLLSTILIVGVVGCGKQNETTNEQEEQTHNESISNANKNEEISNKEDLKQGTTVVPEGCTYWHNNTWDVAFAIYDFNLGTKYTVGQEMPELKNGDIFISDNFMYIYNARLQLENSSCSYVIDETMHGWSVRCANLEKLNGNIELFNEINNQPVIDASYLFANLTIKSELKLTIPSSVLNISEMMYMTKLSSDVTINLDSTPIKYENCFNVAFENMEIIDNQLVYVQPNKIFLNGNCERSVKEVLSKTSEYENVIIGE